jgi:hypothetical protein
MDEAHLIKKGETCVRVSFKRSRGGILVTTKVHPYLEELLKAWGGDESTDVREYGRNWRGLGESPLKVWNLNTDPGKMTFQHGGFSISAPGGELYPGWQNQGEGAPVRIGQTSALLNLSMIRLVGASEPEGVTFAYRGSFSRPFLRDLSDKLVSASKRFYEDYLMPVDITMELSGNIQETRL